MSKPKTKLNMLEAFPAFIPRSAGGYKLRANLTVQTINQTFPLLTSFATSVGRQSIQLTAIKDFPKSPEDFAAVKQIKELLDQYGSDKAKDHDYHNLYGPILKNRQNIKAILEIGMGTNHTDVVSNMGAAGKPGASLRAFRDYLDNAQIYGADVDKRILFSEERIKTFYVDQTDKESFRALNRSIPSNLDLIIDDGLHSPNANIATLDFALPKIKIGGWVVIEDIGEQALPIWELVTSILPASKYEAHLLKAEGAIVFAVKRVA